jgi:hypothetical protein
MWVINHFLGSFLRRAVMQDVTIMVINQGMNLSDHIAKQSALDHLGGNDSLVGVGHRFDRD